VSAHPFFTSFVTGVLSSDLSLRKRVGNRPSASQTMELAGPKLFLLDSCSLPTEPGQLCRQLRRKCPGSKFLCMLPSSTGVEERMVRLLLDGIDGFICLREQWQRELCRAVHAVSNGDYWVPRSVLHRYVRQTAGFLAPDLLTAREIQVANLLLRHLSNREISRLLCISERTVKFHVSNVFQKLGVRSRDELHAGVAVDAAGRPIESTSQQLPS